MAEKEKGIFTPSFWKSFDSLGIYSTEADGLLADQMDAPEAGGSNKSDADENSPESKEQNNESELNLDADNNSNDGDLDTSGMDDSGMGDSGGGDGSSMDSGSGDSSGGGDSEEDEYKKDPEKNPFKSKNGKSLLSVKLADLQAAVTDTLQKIYTNPKIDPVVISELENLEDSIRNIRETVYLIPVESTVYKYDLATATYALLSKEVINELQVDQQDKSISSSGGR